MSPLLSVVVVNWNTCELAVRCVESICEHFTSTECEIIVVDNGSSDDSVARLNALSLENLTVISLDDNLGFGCANNVGSEHAKGQYLLLLNSDTEVVDRSILSLVQLLKDTPDVGIVTGDIYDGEGIRQRSCFSFFTFSQLVLDNSFRLIRRRAFDRAEKLPGCYDQEDGFVHEVDWVCGAFMLLNPQFINPGDGNVFDKQIFMYYEDALLCHRARREGYRVMHMTGVRIRHLHGQSSKKVKIKSILYRTASSVRYVRATRGEPTATKYHRLLRGSWLFLLVVCKGLSAVSRSNKLSSKYEMFLRLYREV